MRAKKAEKKNKESAEKQEGDFHEPSEESYACLRLELYRPVVVGDDTSTRAWKEIRDVRKIIGQSIQKAMGDVMLHVRDLRGAGRWRFATPAERANEKAGIPLPVECYDKEDIDKVSKVFVKALRESGLSEYVYASISQRLTNAEFKGEKLRALLNGEAVYPSLKNVAIMMRARNWSIHTESRISEGKEYLEVYIEMSALRPKAGKIRLYCKRLHGPKLRWTKKLINELKSMGLATEQAGWKKGALSLMPVRRPGQPEKWAILLPYASPRSQKLLASGSELVIAAHRGVTNMITASSDGQSFQFPGRDVVALKHQMHARRRAIARDLTAMPRRGRGAKAHYKALTKLADKERRATETNLWRAARWLQTIVERSGAKMLLLDDFTTFDADKPGPPFEPYVRTFPFSALKLKIVDALTRRAGIPVQEVRSAYISQKCPECGFVSESNIIKLPTIRGANTEAGRFRCGECKFAADLDHVASRNLLGQYGYGPTTRKSSKTG